MKLTIKHSIIVNLLIFMTLFCPFVKSCKEIKAAEANAVDSVSSAVIEDSVIANKLIDTVHFMDDTCSVENENSQLGIIKKDSNEDLLYGFELLINKQFLGFKVLFIFVFIVLLIKVLVGRVVLVISLIEFLIVLANYYIVSILAVSNDLLWGFWLYILLSVISFVVDLIIYMKE